jgi:ankyrin repeat protein
MPRVIGGTKNIKISSRHNVSWTDLHSAAFDGDVERVRELLEKGENPNIKNKDGITPLHVAASKGYVDVVKLLLERGADPNIKDKNGVTPLHWAAYNGHVDVVKLLLKHGADPNAEDKYGATPLHATAKMGHVDVVKLLLERGANPNAQHKDGWTPLHVAASKGHVDVVKLLLERGADPTVRNKDGVTPLDLAREKGYREVVSLIEEWLRRGEKPPQQRKAAKTRPWGGASQKAVSPPAPTAQSPSTQTPSPPHATFVVLSPLPSVDVELVERLSGEAIRYVPVSPSGPSFDVSELGLSSCVFFRCGAYFCIYRCMWQDAAVAVKMPVQYRADFERGAPPHLTQAPPAVLKELETVRSLSHRNVLGLAAAWPRHGVLAYEWGDGGSLRDQRLSGGDVLKALVHVAWGLRYLHSRGVVHGDLKPENVIVVGGVCKIADLASVRRLLSRISGSRVGSCTPGFCAPEQLDLRLGAEARARGFEDRVDVYQLANLILDLIGAETIDGSEWSRDKVEKAAKEAEPLGLSDFVRSALELEPWKRPNAEEAARRIAAEWRKRYS